MSLKRVLLFSLAAAFATSQAETYKIDFSKSTRLVDTADFLNLSGNMVRFGVRKCAKDSSTLEILSNSTIDETLNTFNSWVSEALFSKASTDRIIKIQTFRDGANRTTLQIIIDTGNGSTLSKQIEYIFDTSNMTPQTYKFTCYTPPY